jgi:dehydrogenase/reductase SDR family protein 12
MTLQQLKKIVAFYGRFTLSFTQIGFVFRRLFWSRAATNFHGQHWVVTGASGGLGREMAMAALRGGATVTAVARSKEKLQQLVADAMTAGLPAPKIEQCDVALVVDTQRLIERLVASNQKIDVLVNNVGVLNDDLIITQEGKESSFVTNLLSHYQLTEGLLAGNIIPRGGLVINVTSGGGYNVPLETAPLNVVDVKKYNGVAAYGFHKRAQMVLTNFWREKYGAMGVDFYVMHPGWADTAGVQRSLPRFRKILAPILRDAHSGADTAIWLAAARPSQSPGENVWFDRKARSSHAYPHTRISNETAQSLVAYLESHLQGVAR